VSRNLTVISVHFTQGAVMPSSGQVAAAAITSFGVVAAAVLTIVLPKVLADDAPGRQPDTVAEQNLPTLPTMRETAQLFANKESGPVGATVQVSGQGFAPGESVEIRVHADLVATTTGGPGGDFANVAVEVPSFFESFAKPLQVEINANGKSSIRHANVAFTISG
jgi:hypothetical protein